MVERRKFKRLDISKIQVSWKKESLPLANSLSKNISAGGICLMLNEADILKEGESLHLEFKLPEGERISAKGRVVWSEEFEIIGQNQRGRESGIEFTEITDKDRASIARFVFSAMSQDKPYFSSID